MTILEVLVNCFAHVHKLVGPWFVCVFNRVMIEMHNHQLSLVYGHLRYQFQSVLVIGLNTHYSHSMCIKPHVGFVYAYY